MTDVDAASPDPPAARPEADPQEPFLTPRPMVLVLYFCLLFFTYGYFFQSGDSNEQVRLSQVRGVVEDHRLDVDHYGHSADEFIIYDHEYPCKAPGSMLVGLVPWWLATHLIAPLNLPRWVYEDAATWLTGWWAIGGISALAGVVMLVVLTDLLRDQIRALLVAVAYSLGTICFPFSTLYFGHQVSASVLLMSFGGLYYLRRCPAAWTRPLLRGLILIVLGLVGGFAMVTDYSTPAATIPLCVYACVALWPRRSQIVCYGLGMLVALAILAAYNEAVYRTVFFIPFEAFAASDNHQFPDHKGGFLGLHVPDLVILWNITLGPKRGVFFCNPWLLLLFPGIFMGWRESRRRPEVLLWAAAVFGFVFLNAGMGHDILTWGGAGSTGPRQSIPMVPFAALLAALSLRSKVWRAVFYPTMLYSVAAMLMATATEPRPDIRFENPVFELFLPMYLQAQTALQTGGIFNHHPVTPDDSIAFNLGKLLGLPAPLVLWPLLLFWARTFWVLVRQMSGPRIIAAGGLLLCTALGLAPLPYALSHPFDPRGHGWMATYVRGIVFTGPPSPTYTPVNFNAADVLLRRPELECSLATIEDTLPMVLPLSVEWRTWLEVPQDGLYNLYVESMHQSCVYLDDQLMVDDWKDQSFFAATGERTMTHGFHRLVVRMICDQNEYKMHLLWSRPDQGTENIPLKYVYLRDPSQASSPVATPY